MVLGMSAQYFPIITLLFFSLIILSIRLIKHSQPLPPSSQFISRLEKTLSKMCLTATMERSLLMDKQEVEKHTQCLVNFGTMHILESYLDQCYIFLHYPLLEIQYLVT
jgi:hypothetical protein